jgi:hypothetical protein
MSVDHPVEHLDVGVDEPGLRGSEPPTLPSSLGGTRRSLPLGFSSQKTSTSHRHDTEFFDYFLSHKKTHSKLGGMPEQVAKNIHDALEILGHKGFFDVDDLEEISKANLESCIGQCSSMIVYMNDETMDSEWCCFEWEVAHRLGIPIKVVADLSNFVTTDLVDKVKGSEHSFLLQYQWTDYSDNTRRAVVQQLSRWIAQEGKQSRVHDEDKEFLFTAKGALCIKDGEEDVQLFHNFFEYYMVACGLVYNKDAWSVAALLWTRVVRFMSIACFMICFWRLVYASGPAYTDWFSCLYVVLIHVFLYHGLHYMSSLLSSSLMKGLLQHMANSDLVVVTARHMNVISKCAAILGFLAGAACAVGMVVIYLPLFLDAFYLETPMGTAFGISSAFFFTLVAPIVLVQEMAVLTLLFTTSQLLLAVFESSICSLNELLPTVGLRSFVRSGHKGLAPTEAQVSRFSDQWSNAIVLQRSLQSYVNPVICLHFVLNLMGVLIPLVYLTAYGEDFLEPGDEPWSKWAKPILWWGFSLLCYSVTVFVPSFTSYCLEDVAEEARCLAIVPKTKEFVLISLQTDFSWRLGPLLLTSRSGLLLAVPVLASVACWALTFVTVFG